MKTAAERKEAFLAVAAELHVEILWEEEIVPGDIYLAARNTGVKLLICKENHKNGFIIPTDLSYWYDTYECVKVKE